MSNTTRTDSDGGALFNRRSMLKAVGAGAALATGISGVASAGTTKEIEYNFYGCSQVCVNKECAKAVVDTGDGFRYPTIRQMSNRNDPAVRDWENVYCYEVRDGEAIVGICYEGDLIKNENPCASNYETPTCCTDA